MNGLLLSLIQFILLLLLVVNKDIRTFCIGYVVILVINVGLINTPVEWFYWKKAISDLFLLYFCTKVSIDWKRYLVGSVVICSLLMNIYEGLSYYQTIIYPYRDIIQWWMVEIMFVVLAWNCNWRGIDNVKFCRTDN